MKRNATDVLRRAFDSTIANWQLIVIRIAESILIIGIVIGAIVAMVVPFAVSIGLDQFNPRDVDSASSAVAAVVEHWPLLIYALVVVLLLFAVIIAVHAFVEAGTAQVLVDWERGQAFTLARWFAGGRAAWWSVFWIYNIVWSVLAIVLLLPLGATLVSMIVIGDNTGRVVIGCAGLGITLLLLFPVAIVAAIWIQKAIAVCVARRLKAGEAMREAREQIMRDLARHAIVAFVFFVVSFGAAVIISAVTAPFSVMSNNQPMLAMLFAPMQIASSVLQSIVSAAIAIWFLASYIALTEER